MSILSCAVCGTDRVSQTMETGGHTVALCEQHYQSAQVAAGVLADREATAESKAQQALERMHQPDTPPDESLPEAQPAPGPECAVCGSEGAVPTDEGVALCALHYQPAQEAAELLAEKEADAARRSLEALTRLRQQRQQQREQESLRKWEAANPEPEPEPELTPEPESEPVSILACVGCGSGNVTHTVEGDATTNVLCTDCFERLGPRVESAKRGEDAVLRHQLREHGLEDAL